MLKTSVEGQSTARALMSRLDGKIVKLHKKKKKLVQVKHAAEKRYKKARAHSDKPRMMKENRTLIEISVEIGRLEIKLGEVEGKYRMAQGSLTGK